MLPSLPFYQAQQINNNNSFSFACAAEFFVLVLATLRARQAYKAHTHATHTYYVYERQSYPVGQHVLQVMYIALAKQ